jgi:predicted nucleotidyltransferase
MITEKERMEDIKKIIVPLLRSNDVVRAGIFGSFARGESEETSDIDILIEFTGRKSLLDLAGLEINLEKQLNRKVDLITYNSINPLLKERILKEEVVIL